MGRSPGANALPSKNPCLAQLATETFVIWCMIYGAQLHLNYRLQSTLYGKYPRKRVYQKRDSSSYHNFFLTHLRRITRTFYLSRQLRRSFLENLYNWVRSIYVWCIQVSYIYPKPMLNALLHNVSCNACTSGKQTFQFNTAIYMNDVTTCMNEMQRGLLDKI